MPELPEVESIRLCLEKYLDNVNITNVEVRCDTLGRKPVPDNLCTVSIGTIDYIKRRGKYLRIGIKDRNGELLIHLGMSGRFRIIDSLEKHKHDRIIWTLSNGKWLCYNSVRKLGSVLWNKQELQDPLLKCLGIEPLSDEFNGDVLFSKIKGRTIMIKNILMDQKGVVVGIGNIYANDILFLSGIHPCKTSQDLNLEDCNKLSDNIKEVLKNAIESKGTTLGDATPYLTPTGQKGSYQVKIYGKKVCGACQSVIAKITKGGRATYYCPKCQPE